MIMEGILALLQNEPQFAVVGHTTRPEEALDLLETTEADLLITDLEMPGLNGFDLSQKVREKKPGFPILALSMYGDRHHIARALEAGVSGYVLKNTGKEELLRALVRIRNGQRYFSEEVSLEMMQTFSSPKPAAPPTDGTFPLTGREREIVKLISEELSNEEIGEKLFISERTVETHRKNIFRKTGTKSVAGLMKYAFEHKLLD